MAIQTLKAAMVGVSVFTAAAAKEGVVPEDFKMIYTGTNDISIVDQRPECKYTKSGQKVPDDCCDKSAWDALNISGVWAAGNQILNKEGETAPYTCFVYKAMENAFTDKWARSYIGCENGQVIAAENCLPSGVSYVTDAEYAAGKFTYPMNATFGHEQWKNGTFASCGCDGEAHFNQGPGCYSAANTMAAFASWFPGVFVHIDGKCPEPEEAAPPCSDESAYPEGEWYVYNLSIMEPPKQCYDFSFGQAVPKECCTSAGGSNMIGQTWEELYTQQKTTCPALWGGVFNAFMQCNSDNTVTYGEHCTKNCTPCETVMTVEEGCFKANDIPGTMWFVSSKGCQCGDDMFGGKTTCGDVKKMYREEGCCKNPEKVVGDAKRRLSSGSNGDVANALTSKLRQKLRQKAAVAGPKAAAKLAKEIQEVVQKFT